MYAKPHLVVAALAGCCAAAATAEAQTTVIPVKEDIIRLSPFEVAADKDNGYRANGTLAGTRLRTELRDVAASITVVTKDFMQDIGANTLEDLLSYTGGTEIEGLAGNMSGSSSSNTFTDFSGTTRRTQSQTRVRGLAGADQTRDYFLTSVPMDGYIVDRVELNRGPNAMLFGLGSPAGIINSGLIKALPNSNKTRVESQFDQNSSRRLTFDHNQVLIKDRLAVRVASLLDHQRYQMEPAYIRNVRHFLTSTWSPWKGATFRANTETAKQISNKPYTTTPVDQISWWWALGKPVYNPMTGIGTYLGTRPTDPNLQVFNASGAIQGNLISSLRSALHLIAEDPNSSRLGVTGLAPSIQVIEGSNNRVRLNAAGTALVNESLRRLGNAQSYLQALNRTASPLLNDYWRDFRMTDTSVYNFYDQLIEGPNKREWAFWDNFTTSFEQRLGRNAGVEVAYSWEKLKAGYVQPYQFRFNAINIDITTHLLNGTPNPNLGRPMTNTELGFQNSNSTEREAYRATAFYQLDFTRLKTPWLAELLGRHIFTGSFTNQSRENYSFGGRLNTLGMDYQDAKLIRTTDVKDLTPDSNGRAIVRQSYIGPSLLNAASPRNAGIQRVTALQNFDGAATVTALYYERPPTTTPPVGAWKTGTFSIIQDGRYDLSKTTTGGNHNYDETESVVLVSNNYWWANTLVSTFGWRQDKYLSKQAPQPANGADGLRVLDPAIWVLQPGLTQKVSKFNYGLVLHTPPFLRGKLPLGSDVSFTYNKADNFQPGRQTYDIFNNPLEPTTGKTEEWGVLISLFNNKFELRAVEYKTASTGAVNTSFTEIHNNIVRRLRDQMQAVRATGYRDDVIGRGFSRELAAWDQFEQSPVAKTLFGTYSITPNATNPSLIDITERGGEVVSTSDSVAKGMEFDLVYNPTSQWRIALNAAKQESILSNTGYPLREMVKQLDPVWGGSAGNLPTGLNTNNSLMNSWGTIKNEIDKIALLDGMARPEIRKWRFNAISTYFFKGGRLNGVRIGGAYRWQDKSALGFPVRTLPSGSVIYDVSSPYMGEAETNVDAWIGYSRKLGDRIRWNVQLNVRNIGQGNRLVAVSVQPNGTPDSPRIVNPQMWSLTTGFEF